MSPNIPGNVAKHSGEYHQRFRGIPTTPIRPITLALLMNYYLRISLLGFITVTYKNFAIEIFKVKLGIAPDIMKNVFPIIENPYDLRNKTKFSLEMSAPFDMALKQLILLHQEFGAAFHKVTKNVVLLKNLRQKLNVGIQNTAHANFVKTTSVK